MPEIAREINEKIEMLLIAVPPIERPAWREGLLALLAAREREHAGEVGRLNQKIVVIESARDAARRLRDAALDEAVALTAQVAALTADRDAWKKRADEGWQNAEQIQASLVETQAEFSEVTADRDALRIRYENIVEAANGQLNEITRQAEEIATLRTALAAAQGENERLRMFLDYTVRSWLPNDHTACDSSCSHGAWEREVFAELDAALAPPAPGGTEETP